MTQVVPTNIAKLLKDKGFKKTTLAYYVKDMLLNNKIGKLGSYDECSSHPSPLVNYKDVIAAPTIAEVVEWLYEKHKIWIKVSVEEWFEDDTERKFDWYITSGKYTQIDIGFKSPSEAYFSAFEFTLKELL
jgi:hypothetical protein